MVQIIYEGKDKTRLILVPNVMDTIKYRNASGWSWFYIGVLNYGPGDIYVNWNRDAAIGDPHSLLLKESVTCDIQAAGHGGIDLNIISSSAAMVQLLQFAR